MVVLSFTWNVVLSDEICATLDIGASDVFKPSVELDSSKIVVLNDVRRFMVECFISDVLESSVVLVVVDKDDWDDFVVLVVTMK